VFHEFLAQHRDEILRRSRCRLLEEVVLRPTEDELSRGLPLFLGQLIESLRRYNGAMPDGALEIGESARQFGRDLSRLGLTVTQLVHGYGAVSEAATSLAQERGAAIDPEEHQVLNAVLDLAIAQAVDGYQRERDQGTSTREAEHPGSRAHELRTALAAACVSFRTLKKWGAGCAGRIGDRLEQSLERMRGLIDRALAEARLQAPVTPRMEEIPLVDLIDQIIATAVLGAESRHLTLAATIDPDLSLCGDRQLLLSALANLLEDAVTATRPGGHVQMRGYARGEMVVVEIEDECGDLAPGATEDILLALTQGGADRSGTRPGLPIARQAVSLHGGTVSARTTPHKGCVVIVEIPRVGARGAA